MDAQAGLGLSFSQVTKSGFLPLRPIFSRNPQMQSYVMSGTRGGGGGQGPGPLSEKSQKYRVS